MSKFYGQVEGSAYTTASRRGFKSIRASVQSYYGSVIMKLADEDDEEAVLTVQVADCSSFSGETVFHGKMTEFYKLLKNYSQSVNCRI